MDHEAEWDVVVVGGGLGGLSSAALLARQGLRVKVLERASRLGGRARSRLQDGFVLNQGAHALYRGGPAVRVLAELGVQPRGGVVRGRGSFVELGGRLQPMPRGLASLLTSDVMGARGKLAFMKLMATLGERRARAHAEHNVRQWLERETSDPPTRALLEMFVRLTSYAHAPELWPASTAIRQLAQATRHGVMYLDGGWQSLLDALAARACAAGVDIESNVDVQRIEHSGGVARAVLAADGRRFATRAVIAAVEPSALARLVPEDADTQRWAQAAVPLRAACLDLGVREPPHPERLNVQSLAAPLYFADHTALAKLAPPGGRVLHLVRYLGPSEDGRACEAELRAFLERVQPGVYERAVVKRFVPNLVVHNDLPGRARSQHPAIAGLFLVGDFASERALLADAVFDSASSAATRVQAYCGSIPARVAQHVPASDAGRAA